MCLPISASQKEVLCHIGELRFNHSLLKLTYRFEIKAKREFVGRTLQELDFRKTLGVNVISIQRKVRKIGDDGKPYETTELNDVPGPQDKIEDGDVLLIVGAESDVERLAAGK